jgi:UPF0755 protein
MSKVVRRLGVAAVAVIALLVVLGVGAYVKGREAIEAPGPLPSETTILILPGAGVSRITQLLDSEQVIADPQLFKIAVRLLGHDKLLRAGEYRFPAHVSMQGVIEILLKGESVQYALTIPEGWTVKQALAAVDAVPQLTGNTPDGYKEGTLLPETYAYTRGDTRAELIKRMSDALEETLAKAWSSRAPDLPLRTPEEALILASIVERETGVDGERAQVAGVFINRLRRGMRLQSDPTVIYGLSDGMGVIPRGITRSDLATEHAYNTYVISGLPPGPICLPGKESIEAVLNPADTKDLYFVADGTGGHVFSRTLREHNNNVRKWRAIERAAKREAAN